MVQKLRRPPSPGYRARTMQRTQSPNNQTRVPRQIGRLPAVAATIVASFALALLPPSADAEGQHVWSQFRLDASNGFVIAVERDGPFFSLTTGNGPTGVIYSSLTKPIGAADPMSVEADLGKLGAIAVNFEARGVAKRLPNQPYGCTKTRTKGVFVGSIDFRGERAYTVADATEATGILNTTEGDCDTFDRKARVTMDPRKGRPRGVELVADKTTQGRTINFACSRGEDLVFAADDGKHPQRRYFEAAISEKYRQFNIIRLAVAASDNGSAFAFDDPLTSATAAPPAPFTGTATYRRSPGAHTGSWAGPLSVSFPGAPNTRLAGPHFSASLDYSDDEGM